MLRNLLRELARLALSRLRPPVFILRGEPEFHVFDAWRNTTIAEVGA